MQPFCQHQPTARCHCSPRPPLVEYQVVQVPQPELPCWFVPTPLVCTSRHLGMSGTSHTHFKHSGTCRFHLPYLVRLSGSDSRSWDIRYQLPATNSYNLQLKSITFLDQKRLTNIFFYTRNTETKYKGFYLYWSQDGKSRHKWQSQMFSYNELSP